MSFDKNNALMDCSLASLRAFGEAAKHQSFTLAAAHLSVTQSAISHHIKTLEQQLQVKLFQRRGRQLLLTSEGRILHQAVEKSFTQLARALEQINAGVVRRRVVLGVLSSFATKWLVPRLGAFYRQHPNVELVVRSVNHTIDVEREQVDLAVTTLPAAPASKNVMSALMWRERLFAVCSPEYAANSKKPLGTVEDLAHHTLLHDETEIAAERGFDWLSWLKHFNIESLMLTASCQYFSQSDLTLQAAIAGHGVALTRTSIAATDIKNGALIIPFPNSDIATQSACYLCGEKENWHNETNALLRHWLLAEAETDKTLYQKPRKSCVPY
ncbi:MAG: LysR family transcriptional regulator [Proteobacteria bacterium]|nr:LysR family transcriptional regulator [Pseudomonadota bacterium]MCH9758196.1 LysR family transcriptional regulator [Pseudomonadota bacterium]